MPWDWDDILLEQDFKDPILLKVQGSGLVVVDHHDQHKKLKELVLMVGRVMEECRDMLRHLFSNLNVYQNHLEGVVK